MISSSRRPYRTVLAICSIGVVGAVFPTAAARAALVNLSPCNISALSQPFAPWEDVSSYELAPGGDFESSAWTVTGGAQVVPGSESFAASGTPGSFSLSLPAGSSAESPPTCVDAAYPTIRFFVAGTGIVAVAAVYGNLVIPSGLAVATGRWLPTLVMVTGSAVPGALLGGSAEVSLRLTALTGSPKVDDVFIDPWNRG